MSTQTKEVQSCSGGGNTAPSVAPADLPCTCRVCGGVLEAKYQALGLPDKPGYWIVTCWNRTCGLFEVTRSASSYPAFDLAPYLVEKETTV